MGLIKYLYWKKELKEVESKEDYLEYAFREMRYNSSINYASRMSTLYNLILGYKILAQTFINSSYEVLKKVNSEKKRQTIESAISHTKKVIESCDAKYQETKEFCANHEPSRLERYLAENVDIIKHNKK